MKRTKLREREIRCIRDLCDDLELRCSHNMKAVELCQGISEFVQERGYITEKQAAWLAQNAEYHDLPVPTELKQFMPPLNGKLGQTYGRSSNGSGYSIDIREQLDRIEQCVERLFRFQTKKKLG